MRIPLLLIAIGKRELRNGAFSVPSTLYPNAIGMMRGLKLRAHLQSRNGRPSHHLRGAIHLAREELGPDSAARLLAENKKYGVAKHKIPIVEEFPRPLKLADFLPPPPPREDLQQIINAMVVTLTHVVNHFLHMHAAPQICPPIMPLGVVSGEHVTKVQELLSQLSTQSAGSVAHEFNTSACDPNFEPIVTAPESNDTFMHALDFETELCIFEELHATGGTATPADEAQLANLQSGDLAADRDRDGDGPGCSNVHAFASLSDSTVVRCLAFVWIFVFYATYRFEDIDTLHRIYDSADAHFCVAVWSHLQGFFGLSVAFWGTDISWLFCVTAVVGSRGFGISWVFCGIAVPAPSSARGSPAWGKHGKVKGKDNDNVTGQVKSGGKDANVKDKNKDKGLDQDKNKDQDNARLKIPRDTAYGSRKVFRADIPPCACPGARIDLSSAPSYEDAAFVADFPEDAVGAQTKGDKDKDKDSVKDKNKDTNKDHNTGTIEGLGDVVTSRAWSLGDHVRLHDLRTATLNGESGVISKLHAGLLKWITDHVYRFPHPLASARAGLPGTVGSAAFLLLLEPGELSPARIGEIFVGAFQGALVSTAARAGAGPELRRAVLPFGDARLQRFLLGETDRLPADGCAVPCGVLDAGVAESARLRWLWPDPGEKPRRRRMYPGQGKMLVPEAAEVLLEGPWLPSPMPPPLVDVLLALPRPQQLERILPQVAQVGVGTVLLCGAAKVEDRYFESSALAPEALRRGLAAGLAEAGRGRPLAVAELEPLLRKGGLLDELSPRGRAARLVAHPRGAVETHQLPRAGGRGGAEPLRVLVALGPEAGWDEPAELDLFRGRGLPGRQRRAPRAALGRGRDGAAGAGGRVRGRARGRARGG
ncbi:unnamed protein product [Prorocentrum cordatum]|uniref:Ribosomal RNA small subunit methyltransferase E methyltransferase domain-containing protein n=1 Tax=Prorocentrum cordatum TaxID=2364126 RepID=A0ABN9YEK4_9DINO|nr:unnamed protein product [Polarella glacialis]